MAERRAAVLAKLRADPAVSRREALLKGAIEGSAKSGMTLLSTALEALAKAIKGEPLNDADRLTLDFLRTGLHRFIVENKKPLERALFVEDYYGGRPSVSEHAKHTVFEEVQKRIAELQLQGHPKPKMQAYEDVGKAHGKSGRWARSVCTNEHGKRLNSNVKS